MQKTYVAIRNVDSTSYSTARTRAIQPSCCPTNAVSHVMGVQGNDDLVESVSIPRDETCNAFGVSLRTRHCKGTSFVEVVLRIHHQQSRASQRHLSRACRRREGGVPPDCAAHRALCRLHIESSVRDFPRARKCNTVTQRGLSSQINQRDALRIGRWAIWSTQPMRAAEAPWNEAAQFEPKPL